MVTQSCKTPQRAGKLTPTQKHAHHLESARRYYERNKERLREKHRNRMRLQRAKQKELKMQQRDLSVVQTPGSAPPSVVIKKTREVVCHHCGHPIDLKQALSMADVYSSSIGEENDSGDASEELDE